MNVWSQRRFVTARFLPQLLKIHATKCIHPNNPVHRLWKSTMARGGGSASLTVSSSELSQEPPDGCEGCWITMELDFSKEMIELDCRNNTVWSFRYATTT